MFGIQENEFLAKIGFFLGRWRNKMWVLCSRVQKNSIIFSVWAKVGKFDLIKKEDPNILSETSALLNFTIENMTMTTDHVYDPSTTPSEDT